MFFQSRYMTSSLVLVLPISCVLAQTRQNLLAASEKWKEARAFEQAGKDIPAAMRLEEAARLAAPEPSSELTKDDLCSSHSFRRPTRLLATGS
jgi:hypothetical protein